MAHASRIVAPRRLTTARATLFALALLLPPAAGAQQRAAAPTRARAEVAPPTPAVIVAPEVRLIERSPGRVVYSVEATWGVPLVEAARAAAGDADRLAVEAVGGWLTNSVVVGLPAAVPPVVDVIAADAEEAPLPAGARVREMLEGPAAEVLGLGYERGRPMGTLAIRLLQADPEAGVLRRYRRLVIAVTYPVAADFIAAAGGGNPHLGVGNSALSSGTWFRIPVSSEGVYRIDRAYLASLGVDPLTTDPGRLQIYGNGGRPLPALNSAPRPVDLVENATLAVGAGDGSFAEGDALYFFAEGPSGWNWDDVNQRWTHFINPFTTTTAYFLRVDDPDAQRVFDAPFPAWTDVQRLEVLEGRVFDEEDRNTIAFTGGGSGLQWLGVELSSSRSATTMLDTTIADLAGGTVTYRALVAARSLSSPATLQFSGSGMPTTSLTPPATNPSATDDVARMATGTFQRDVPGSSSLRLDVRLTGGNSGSLAWPDWAEAVYPQAPRATAGVLRFATPGGQVGRFEVPLDGFSGQPEVWDVTDPGSIQRLPVQQEGARWVARVEVADSLRPREVVAFNQGAAAIATPAAATPVANQNLHGTATAAPYVIVTPAEFRAAADELAEYRRGHDGLEPLVVNMDQVFNEFSGGVMDMRAVRDYFRFLFDRAAAAGQEPLRYGLLFGDGHHDYRGITPEGRQNNWVPVYETDESFNPLRSYTSDDYFAFLDPNEGVWAWTEGPSFERVDIGVGRIPARTAEEAAAVVNKIRRYEAPASMGDWRTRVTLIADDNHPGNEGSLFLAQSEQVANVLRTANGGIDLEKVYMLSYEEVITAQGRRVPGAAADAKRAIEEGTLIWNYIGHGGPEALTDERILELGDIAEFDNIDRLAIFATATCSFGRFDLEAFQSGAEALVLHPDGGAVAALTTVRLVFAGGTNQGNLGLNLRLAEFLARRDTSEIPGYGLGRRLGDVYRETKRTDVGAQGNNRKFSLLGDPAMRVGLAERPMAIESINGVILEQGDVPEFRALEEATISGRVLGFDGQPDPSFDGEVDIVVYDAARTVEVDVPSQQQNPASSYQVRSELLFRGRASAAGGAFTARFIVPQDVSYSGRPARVVAYARRSDGVIDGSGATEQVTVATTSGAPLNDQAGPTMRLFLNDSTFVSGGLTGPDPVLIVRLEDESGINAVGSGVGHDLLLVIDGDEAGALDIGRFFQGDLDNSRAGTLRVPLNDLAPGPHTVRVTAWDVANNVSTGELSFLISGTDELALRNVFNYPNPTPGPTRFSFEHNQAPGTPARVRLRVYTLAGRPVVTIDGDASLPGGVLPGGLVQIPWEGRDEDLDRLATGVYLWHLRVEVDRPEGGTDVVERVERLALIR